jgi:tRNA1(Val) A37 N6-methylase TrmN6
MKRLSWNDQTETLDTLFEGRLKILQKKRGYRFSIDALLLAHFADPGPKDRIIDLGTGCGILPLILLFRRKASRIIGVEIQPSLADLARRNAFHVIDSTRVCSITANLGDTKTTITHPASTSHSRLTEAQRQAAGITQGLIRLAVGLDDVADLQADLRRGLDTLST